MVLNFQALFPILLTMAYVPTAGCAGKPQETLFPVRGKITLNGAPLPRGSVALRAESQHTWHQPTGVVEPPGEYVIYTNSRSGAPPGAYRVVVFATEHVESAGAAHPGLPKSLIPVRYNSPDQTPLKIDVMAKPGPQAFDLELKSDVP